MGVYFLPFFYLTHRLVTNGTPTFEIPLALGISDVPRKGKYFKHRSTLYTHVLWCLPQKFAEIFHIYGLYSKSF